MVHPKTDGSHAYHLDTTILNSLASATYTADAIRRHGAIASLELSHSGMYAGTYQRGFGDTHSSMFKEHGCNVYLAAEIKKADPFLPRKVMENKDDQIVKCLRCFTCMAERAMTSTRRCTVNPLIGREIEGCEVHPAYEKKKVLVAGGGPGGLYAAYTAARRGHQVILCEKESEIGGILKSEQAIQY